MRSKIWLIVFIFAFSCTNGSEEDAADDGTLQSLRADMQFTLTPGTEVVTGLIRFRKTVQGVGVSLPGEVLVDDAAIQPDSTEMNGVFYEIQLPLADFFREHSISIRQQNKVYSEKFTVNRFALPAGFLAPDGGSDMVFDVEGVDDGQEVLVMMIDTSFDNQDLQKRIAVKERRFVIPSAALDSLSAGPISAEVHFEQRIVLQEIPFRRGTITIRQMVTGEFDLRK